MTKKENIPTGSYPSGKMNSEGMNREYRENISIEEIRELELKWFEGEIVVVDNIDTFKSVIPRLMRSELLGFDTETKPSFKKGKKNKVSLIQLADRDLACLFRINKIGLPDELVKILANRDVIKAGVAIHDDIKILKHIRKFEPEGFIDLQGFVKDYGIESSGLKKLTAIILGFRISKSQQVTDWEATELTEPQRVYAATDAWVCREIYDELVSSPLPPGGRIHSTGF
jgi:ribonuclease D